MFLKHPKLTEEETGLPKQPRKGCSSFTGYWDIQVRNAMNCHYALARKAKLKRKKKKRRSWQYEAMGEQQDLQTLLITMQNSTGTLGTGLAVP